MSTLSLAHLLRNIIASPCGTVVAGTIPLEPTARADAVNALNGLKERHVIKSWTSKDTAVAVVRGRGKLDIKVVTISLTQFGVAMPILIAITTLLELSIVLVCNRGKKDDKGTVDLSEDDLFFIKPVCDGLVREKRIASWELVQEAGVHKVAFVVA